MTRNEQLAFCKICKHKKMDAQQGIICWLTGTIANFEETCPTFEKDEAYAEKQEQRKLSRGILPNLATTTDRFINRIVDYIVVMLISILIGVSLGIFSRSIGDNTLVYKLENTGRLFDYITGFILTIIYYSFFEAIFEQSIGKMITKTKVVDEKGNKASLSTILLRSLCRFIPFNAFSFLGDSPIGWHDSLSKTRVIKVTKEKTETF